MFKIIHSDIVEFDNDKTNIISKVKEFKQRKATDDFELCGVYHTSGLPYETIKITRDDYPDLEPYKAVPRAFSDHVYKAIKEGNKVLTSSGYCIYAPAIIGGIQRAIGEDKKIGVVWIDAHSDNVIVEDTSRDSVTLVGVPVSTFLGQTMVKWSQEDCKLNRIIDSDHLLISDVRCSDEECIRNLNRTQAHWLKENEFENQELWQQEVNTLASKVDAIYLMVDADILLAKHIPAYFRKEPGGHSIDIVMRNVATVMNTNKVVAFSTFCFDFDKYEQGGEVTYLNAMRLIGAGLKAWKYYPNFK